MKTDEAISILKQYTDYNNPDIPDFYTMEEACKVVIEALEQETCEDCISREATIKTISEWFFSKEFRFTNASEYLRKRLDKLPSVTPQQKMGRWIEHFDESGKWYECDQCHTDWGGSVNYCPACGAKM